MHGAPSLPTSVSANRYSGAYQKTHKNNEYIQRYIKPDAETARKFWYSPFIKESGKSLVERTITSIGGVVTAYVAHKTTQSPELLWSALYSVIPQDLFDYCYYQHSPMENDNIQFALVAATVVTAGYAGKKLSSQVLRLFLSIPQSLEYLYTGHMIRTLADKIDQTSESQEKKYVKQFISKQITETLISFFEIIHDDCYEEITKAILKQDSSIRDYEPLNKCKEECLKTLENFIQSKHCPINLQEYLINELIPRFKFINTEKLTEFICMIPKKELIIHVKHSEKAARTELLSHYYYILLLSNFKMMGDDMIRDMKDHKKTRKTLTDRLMEKHRQKEQLITDLILTNTQPNHLKPKLITSKNEATETQNTKNDNARKIREDNERFIQFSNAISNLEGNNITRQERRTNIKFLKGVINNTPQEERNKKLCGLKKIKTALNLINTHDQ